MKELLTFNEIGFEVLEDILTQDEVGSLAAVLQAHQLKPLSGAIAYPARMAFKLPCPFTQASRPITSRSNHV